MNIDCFLRTCLQGVGIAIPTATGLAVLQHRDQTAAWAGYILSIIQFVTQAIYDLIMQAGNIDTALVTVERLEECKHVLRFSFLPSMTDPFSADSRLPSEVETDCPTPVPSSWPLSGHLQVENLSAAYDHDLPQILHDLTFEVQPAERVGVVGRT